jgi:hypothetical protein
MVEQRDLRHDESMTPQVKRHSHPLENHITDGIIHVCAE